MRKNYRKGIMKIDDNKDEITRFNRECLEEISRLPCFESEGDPSGITSSSANDGVKSDDSNK